MDRYIILALAALAQARFQQENLAQGDIAAVQGGEPGAAATLAGGSISTLLGGADPCDKLAFADRVATELGGGADAIAAAIGLVQAEQNFNPSLQDTPNICTDPSLPATAELRGRTPLVDPAVTDSDVANALQAQTAGTPLDATGKSIADLLAENGFTQFNGAAGGAAAGGAAAGAGNADAGNTNTGNANAGNANGATNNNQVAEDDCNDNAAAGNGNAAGNNNGNANQNNNGNGNANNNQNNNGNANNNQNNNGNQNDNAVGNGAAAGGNDFGTCDPTMSFEGGRGNRPADEFTFQSNDPAIEANQQEALNPNIITNRICDELGNICGANDAAIATCEDAQAQIEALGTRDQTTADAWNQLVGGGAARMMRRGARLL